MRFLAAIFFALAVAAAQILHGGLLIPALAYPALLLCATGAICSVPAALYSRRQPWASPSFWVIMLGAYMLWRCADGPDTSLAIGHEGMILGCLAMWAGSSLSFQQNNARFTFVGTCIVAACVQVVIALVQIWRPEYFSQLFWFSEELKGAYLSRFPQRAKGLFLNPNQFAWFMNIMCMLTLSLGVWGRLKMAVRVTVLYMAVVFGVMTILSASRGGAISLLVGVVMFGGLSMTALFSAVTNRRLLFLSVGTIVVVSGACAAYAAFSTSWVAQGRFSAMLVPEVRGGFIEQALRLFQTYPLLGSGPGMFQYAARFYRSGDVSGDPLFAHNDLAQFLAEYGFVGFSVALIVVFLVLVFGARSFLALVQRASEDTGSAMSSSAAFALGAVCALAASLVHSNVDFNLHVPANALLTAAMVGLVTSARPLRYDESPRGVRLLNWGMAMATLAIAVGLAIFLDKRAEPDYHALQSANAFRNGDIKLALENADEGLRELPNDPALLALRGRSAFEFEAWLENKATPEEVDFGDDNGDEGEDKFMEDHAPILTQEQSLKNFQDAADFYRKAIKVQPRERAHYLGLANALAAAGKDKEARGIYLAGITYDPWHSLMWGKLGDFLWDRDLVLEAKQIYELGANLPGGQYCREQVISIDEDLADEKENPQ